MLHYHFFAKRLNQFSSKTVDYSKLKLFQLSILWRAGISDLEGFGQISLGPHAEILRRMLVDENPGKASDYGCIMMTLPETEILHKVILGPILVRSRPFGHRAYKYTTGNLTWVFFVSGHTIHNQVQEFFVQETGLLRVWLAADEKALVLNIGRNLRMMERKKS